VRDGKWEMGEQRYTYKIFCNSFDDVDLFACICLRACLLEYLFLLSVSAISTFRDEQNVPLHFISSLIID
jgi:hypothetical protein